jgi:hypothetical protein
MKKHSVLYALLAAGLASALSIDCHAAAPTIDASMSGTFSTNVKCTLTTCTQDIRAIYAGSHTIELTPIQESTLETSTAIVVEINGSGISFSLGDDPRFQNGDTSAKIKKVVTFPAGRLTITAKLKWGNGSISINAKQTVIEKFENAAPLAKDIKAVTPLILNTIINTPSQPVFNVEVPLACDITILGKQQTSAEGAQRARTLQAFKSKFIVEP